MERAGEEPAAGPPEIGGALTDRVVAELRATELEVTHGRTYLDHATFGPPPRCHVRAACEVLERTARDGLDGTSGSALLEEVRAEAATLLHGEARHVALLKSTSEGLGLLAQGLDWRAGDEVVVIEHEFAGCVAPFLHLRERGVGVQAVADRGRDRFDLADVEALLTTRTRAVCLSLVNRSHGMRAPVEAIGELCRERGIWLAVDAAQAMGVLDLDARAIGADVLAAHGYKFLCSGFGLAVTHCSERALTELTVPQVGWKNAELVDAPAGAADARRFESTMPSLPLLAGMGASLRLLNGFDPVERERRAVALAVAAADGLEARSYALRSSRRPGEGSSLVAARHPSLGQEEVVRELRAAGVACAGVDGALRVSTHFFNTAEDVEALLAALPG